MFRVTVAMSGCSWAMIRASNSASALAVAVAPLFTEAKIPYFSITVVLADRPGISGDAPIAAAIVFGASQE